MSTLAEDVAEAIGDARAVLGELGLRPYRVEAVRVHWSGGEVGRGLPEVTCTCALAPQPRVEIRTRRELTAAGALERGTAVLSEIPPMPEAELLAQFALSPPLGPGDEAFVELVLEGGTGTRQRFVLAQPPERRPLEWRIELRAQDSGRTPCGAPSAPGRPGPATFGR